MHHGRSSHSPFLHLLPSPPTSQSFAAPLVGASGAEAAAHSVPQPLCAPPAAGDRANSGRAAAAADGVDEDVGVTACSATWGAPTPHTPCAVPAHRNAAARVR
eukprot:353058-Chlamydomonas_euryale.AAC.7